MNTSEIAERLVKYCRASNWEAAQKELFAADAVSIEAEAKPGSPKETKGLAAIIEKGRKFGEMIVQMHSLSVSDPLVAGTAFACSMAIDVTMKGQPRMQMSELCLYEVKDGKIISERFFP